MDSQPADDAGMVLALIPHWHAVRRWAEEVLCRVYGFRDASEILKPENRGRATIPGSTWIYRTHGAGVNIDRGLACGGIDFDFNQAVPDPWRLRLFAEKQLNAGCLPPAYALLIDDEDRFVAAYRIALSDPPTPNLPP